MKKILTLVILASIFIIIVLGCSSAGNTNTPITQNSANSSQATANEKPITIKADTLTKEYDENELAADGKYKGKMLEVSGRIENIAETFGQLSVQLEGFKQNGINLLSVMCSFSASEKDSLSKLKKGQQITLLGTGDGKTGGLYVGINECRVK